MQRFVTVRHVSLWLQAEALVASTVTALRGNMLDDFGHSGTSERTHTPDIQEILYKASITAFSVRLT